MDEEAYKNFMKNDFKELSNWIYSLNAYEFVTIATLIGALIAPTLTINQQNSLGNFFEQIGQTLLTIAAQNQTVKHKQKQQSSINQEQNEDLKTEINNLKKEMIQLRKDALMNDNI